MLSASLKLVFGCCAVLLFLPRSAAQPEGPPVIDALILVTPSAAAWINSLPASASIPAPDRVSRAIDFAILNLNLIASNSGARFRFRSVTATATPIEFEESDHTDENAVLAALEAKTDGVLDAVHAQRDALGADCVILIVNAYPHWPNWSGGDANVMYTNSASVSEYAPFAMVDCTCVEVGSAFYHEVGHMLGLQHDWFASASKKVPYPYAFGYINTEAQFSTLMAYDAQCEEAGTVCPRIKFYSNPDVEYRGLTTGVAAGTRVDCVEGTIPSSPCDANAAMSLTRTAPTFSTFRDEAVSSLEGGTPVLQAPSGTVQTFTPSFTFASVASSTRYRILVGVAPEAGLTEALDDGAKALAHAVFDADDVCAPSVSTCTVSLASVQFSSGHHYWSVRGETETAVGRWADAAEFVLGSEATTGAPKVTPLAPGDLTFAGQPAVCHQPTWVWREATGEGLPGTPAATRYRILIWNVDENVETYSTEWLDASVVCDGRGQCSTTPDEILAAGPNYLWRVRADSPYGRGVNSQRLYFTVDASLCCAHACAKNNCGAAVSDGCGGTLDCGNCSDPSSTCSAGECVDGPATSTSSPATSTSSPATSTSSTSSSSSGTASATGTTTTPPVGPTPPPVGTIPSSMLNAATNTLTDCALVVVLSSLLAVTSLTLL